MTIDRKLKNIIFGINPNLLFILCGVFTSVTINLLTSFLNSGFDGISSLLYILSIICSIYMTVLFCSLTFKIIRIDSIIKNKPESKLPEGLRKLQDKLYPRIKKIIKITTLKLFLSSSLFFILLIIKYIYINSYTLQNITNKYIFRFYFPIKFDFDIFQQFIL